MTVVEILSDDDKEEQITNALAEENIINESYLYTIKIIEKTLDTNRKKTNDIDLETLVRENSWLKCDKCEFKAKSEMSLRKHEEKQHSFNCEENMSGLQYESRNFVAKTERKLQNHEVIHHTVEDKNWNAVWYGCQICKGNTELKDRWRNMTWSSK